MVVELIIPIETMRGKLKNDGYYFRVCKGKQIVQRTPRTWTDTPARKKQQGSDLSLPMRRKKIKPERMSNRVRQTDRISRYLVLWSERRSPLLLPFELPIQGNSPC